MNDQLSMTNETTISGQEAPKHVIDLRVQMADRAMQQLIEICAEYFEDCEIFEDAINIAKLVICSGEEDEDTAERILNSMGFLLSLMTDWEGLKPETVVRMKQIRSLAIPGYPDE